MFDLSPLEFRISELERRLNNVLRPGTIAEADYAKARVRVKLGENVSAWLPWITRRAGSAVEWWAPEIGEQVLVLSPGGELTQGVVLPALYSTAHPAPSNDQKIRRVVFGDSSSVEYDETAHSLMVTVNGGDTNLRATGKVSVKANGDVSVESIGGNVTVDGTNVILNGGASGGVVCQLHTCAFTGSPHPQGSATVKAGG